MLKSEWENEFFSSPFPEIFQGHTYCCFASEFKQFKVLTFLVKPGATYSVEHDSAGMKLISRLFGPVSCQQMLI